MKTQILGSSYVARSVNAANARMVNLFPEIIAEGGKEPAFLQRAPGLQLLLTVGTGPIRGMWAMGDKVYAVSGSALYEITSKAVATKIGNVSGTANVSMADNGFQLFVACNGPSYIYNTKTKVFTPITSSNFPGAITVSYIDGYFVFNEPNSQRVWVTALFDGTTVGALDFASAEGAPYNVVGLLVDHREVWIFSTNTVEVWYDAGASNFPLQRIQGAYEEIGCVAPNSITKLDGGIFWLGADARGRGIVYRTQGYSGKRVSTHAVEWSIQHYVDMSDAIGYSYQQNGHTFYVLIFPSANTTWVYDVATQAWHERAGFVNGAFTRHRSNCHVTYNNIAVVGDYQNGNIYALNLNVYDDNGAPQRWLRSWRALGTEQNNLKRSTQHSLQLDCEAGVGLNTGQGSDPQVMLRWSDDGGHTWSNEHWVSIGKIGEYGRRAIWRKLGMTTKIRDRVYELSMTDPVSIAIMGAELYISPTNA